MSTNNSSSSSSTSSSYTLANILPPFWKDIIKGYLRDDAPTFDIGGYVVGDSMEMAKLLCKTSSILAGIPFFNAVFEELNCTIEWNYTEGTYIQAPAVVAIVKGPVRNLLLGERTALNILSRASGIATASHELVEIAKQHQWHGEVAGTRKITPGFRLIEKYALLVGGASTHRMDLSHMVMLKGKLYIYTIYLKPIRLIYVYRVTNIMDNNQQNNIVFSISINKSYFILDTYYLLSYFSFLLLLLYYL